MERFNISAYVRAMESRIQKPRQKPAERVERVPAPTRVEWDKRAERLADIILDTIKDEDA